jgi:hypothetical protein
MDSDDDTRDALDQLSSLFEPRTAPLPAPVSMGASVTAGSDAAPDIQRSAAPSPSIPSAFGRPAPDPSPVPPATAAPAGPAFAAPPPVDAVGRPPFSPPPLVPVNTPRTPDAVQPGAGSPAPSAPASASAPALAPAFGGAAIARPRGRRAAVPPASSEPPTSEPPTLEPHTLEPPVAEPVAVTPVAEQPMAEPAVAGPPPDLSGPLLPGHYEEVDEERLARSTPVECILFALAFLVPPVGLIGTIVAAARSSSRRGWVIGLLKAGMAVGVVFSLVTAGFAYAGYNVLQQRQAHDRIAAASARFCAAMTKDPTLARGDGGWPVPEGTVPQSLTAMQGFVDRWNALAKVSPSGIRSKVAAVAAAGAEIVKTVTAQRTIDDAGNRSLVESAVDSSGVQNWRSEYCG